MASIQYLTEIIGSKHDILKEALTDKNVSAKRRPTLEACCAAVVKVIQRHAIEGAASLIRDELAEALQDHRDIFGERDAAKDPDEWDTQLDNAVEDIYTPYSDILTADFMATATIDSGLWQDTEKGTGVERAAAAFGKEVYKQLSWLYGTKDIPGGAKSPVQIMTSAAIMQSDVIGAFGDRISDSAPAPAAQPPEWDQYKQPEKVMQPIEPLLLKILNTADMSDEASVREEIEGLIDSDDVLSEGSASRLGLDEGDNETFQLLALDIGDTAAVDNIMAMLADPERLAAAVSEDEGAGEYAYEDAGAPPAAPAPTPPAPTPTSAAQPGKTQALVILKEHSGVDINSLATGAGVSRATFNNYLKGSSEWKADDDAVSRIRAIYVTEINALLEGFALLDGVQAMAVQ